MFDVVRVYGTILILKEHTLPRFFLHLACALYTRTRLPIHACPRAALLLFVLNDILKKVYAPHDARSLYAYQQIMRSLFAAFFGSMTHRKEQTHYHANSRTIAIQYFKFLTQGS